MESGIGALAPLRSCNKSVRFGFVIADSERSDDVEGDGRPQKLDDIDIVEGVSTEVVEVEGVCMNRAF